MAVAAAVKWVAKKAGENLTKKLAMGKKDTEPTTSATFPDRPDNKVLKAKDNK